MNVFNNVSPFAKFMEQDFHEWEKLGFCTRAADLNNKMKEDYFCITNPHHFTGDPHAAIILIHLNPKRAKNRKNNLYVNTTPKESGFNDYKEYLYHFTNFGKKHYGINSSRDHKSPFDHKQLRFLRPFEMLPLRETDMFQNLENVIDKKLQLELIPYGSNVFDYLKIEILNISPYTERILSEIIMRQREYVIFCGRVFEELLQKYMIQKRSINFKLKKNDGLETKNLFQIINLKLSFNEKEIICAIAPQFAKRGYPVEAYGKKIRELYGTF